MKHSIAMVFAAASAALVGLVAAPSAFAHITLQDGVAAAGASYRAVLRVGHGCEGSPTTGISVTVPDGFVAAQPMVKPGWTVTTQVGPLAQPYEMHGKKFTEGVRQITWTAVGPDTALPDALYDEFVLRGTTPKKPGPLWFKVVQTCATGSNPWVEIPKPGASAHDLKFPAALLEILNVQPAGAGHQH